MTAPKPLFFLCIALFISIVNCQAQQMSMDDSISPDQSYNNGVDLLRTGNYEAAIREFDAVILKSRYDIDAYYNRGIARFKMQDTLRACKDWSTAALLGDTTAYRHIHKYCNDLIIMDGDTLTLDQARMNDTSKAYTFVEEMPQFMGGDIALMEFLQKNIIYPEKAKSNHIHGKVYVTFTINKFGEVLNPEILKGVDRDLENEALRVVKLMPRWIPGRLNGIPVNVRYNLPLIF